MGPARAPCLSLWGPATHELVRRGTERCPDAEHEERVLGHAAPDERYAARLFASP
jgi:hypothetical protein